MGLFSSKKKTYVNTTVQKVFDEKQIPQTIRNAVFKSILNDGNIVDYVLEGSISSIGLKADIGYKWAKEHYSYGVPVGQMTRATGAQDVVYRTLASDLGVSIVPDYYRFGPLNSLQFGWQKLMDEFAYDPQTNEIRALSASVGFPVFLSNMVATYQRSTFDSAVKHGDLGVFEQWGPSPTSGYTPSNPYNTLQGFGLFAAQTLYAVSDVATEDYITLTYEFDKQTKELEGPEGFQVEVIKHEIVSRGLTFSMAGINLDQDYHQVRYRRIDGGIGFFTYLDGAGSYPDIDDVQDTQFNDQGTYYPWTYLRYNKQNLGHDSLKHTQAFKDSVRWCNYLGVNFTTLSDAIHQDPNVDDVEQALMMFGVNCGATSQVELEYLFEYFSLMYLNGAASVPMPTLEQFDVPVDTPGFTQVIQDNRFRTQLTHSGVLKKRVFGTIGKIGHFTSELTNIPVHVSYFTYEERRGKRTQTVNIPCYVYRKQVTSRVYEEVRVNNPNLYYQISGRKGHSAGPGTAELLIPVDRAVINTLPFRKREELLCRAMYIVVNTKIVVKSKWYQSSWFKVVLIVVAIVITIVTMGGGSAVWASLTAMSATALTVAVIEYIVISLVVSYAMKLFVKAVGPEIGLIVAIAAIAYGVYSGTTAVEGSSSALWGERLLYVGNNLSKATVSEYQALVVDAQKDLLDFQAFSQGEFSKLNDKRGELGLNGRSHALDFITVQPMVVFGESPNDLYTRTVHSGNIGVASYAMVSDFVGNSLSLPRINQTLGDSTDGSV